MNLVNRSNKVRFLIGAAILTLIPSAVLADPAPDSVKDDGAIAPDTAPAALVEFATEHGALGGYLEGGGHVTIVLPSDVDINEAQLDRFDVDFSTTWTQVTADDIAAVKREAATFARDNNVGLGVGFDVRRGVIVVEGAMPESDLRSILGGMGDKVVYDRHEGDNSRLSRQGDTAPHWGGAYVESPWGGCTSGFTVKKSGGTKFMVTAGHCAALNANIDGGTGIDWGSVTNRATYPAKDMELIGDKTYSGYFYVGGSTGTGVDVVDAGNPVVGADYCFSGVPSTASCSHEAVDTDFLWCDDSGDCTDHTVKCTGSALEGDSGAPFFFVNGTNHYIRGIIIGRATGGYSIYQKWSTIRDTFNVTIVTP